MKSILCWRYWNLYLYSCADLDYNVTKTRWHQGIHICSHLCIYFRNMWVACISCILNYSMLVPQDAGKTQHSCLLFVWCAIRSLCVWLYSSKYDMKYEAGAFIWYTCMIILNCPITSALARASKRMYISVFISYSTVCHLCRISETHIQSARFF